MTGSGAYVQPSLLGIALILTSDPVTYSEHFNTGPKHTENSTAAYE